MLISKSSFTIVYTKFIDKVTWLFKMDSNLISAIIGAVTAIFANILYDAIKNGFMERQKFIRLQLSEFYDPIFALLSVNADIFEKLGPASRKKYELYDYIDDDIKEQNHRVWLELVDKVVIPNNSIICDIIKNKLYLIAKDDDIEQYIMFTTHAFVYREFHEKPFESYKSFQFPTNFDKHVAQYRAKLKRRIKTR